jgi:hypothetical protein
MNQMLSSTTARQRTSRSWFWQPRRRGDAAPVKPEAKVEESEQIEVKPASWPRQRAIWMPPLTT